MAKSVPILTVELINKLAHQAYRDMGYEVVTFKDDSVGITKCPAKTIKLMNRFQELLYNVADPQPKCGCGDSYCGDCAGQG